MVDCQRSFDTIKELLIALQLLCILMPTNKFWLESDISKWAAGGALFQCHFEWVLTGYHSESYHRQYGIIVSMS